MKNKSATWLFAFAMCFFTLMLKGQNDYLRHQLFAGYGFGLTGEVLSQMGNAFEIDFIQSIFSDSTSSGSVIPLYAGYRCFLKKRFSIGLNLGFPIISSENQTSAIQSKTSDKQQFHSVIFLPKLDVHYVNRKVVDLYSGISAGILLQSKDDMNMQQPNVSPAYQITALGFFFGNSVGFFAEIGYGVNGVVSFGLASKFGSEEMQKEKSSEMKFAKRQTHSRPCIRL